MQSTTRQYPFELSCYPCNKSCDLGYSSKEFNHSVDSKLSFLQTQACVVRLNRRLNHTRSKIARTQVLKQKVESALMVQKQLAQRRVYSQYHSSMSQQQRRRSVEVMKHREKEEIGIRRYYYQHQKSRVTKEFRQKKQQTKDRIKSQEKRLDQSNRYSADKVKREHHLQRERLKRFKQFKQQRARSNHSQKLKSLLEENSKNREIIDRLGSIWKDKEGSYLRKRVKDSKKQNHLAKLVLEVEEGLNFIKQYTFN